MATHDFRWLPLSRQKVLELRQVTRTRTRTRTRNRTRTRTKHLTRTRTKTRTGQGSLVGSRPSSDYSSPLQNPPNW